MTTNTYALNVTRGTEFEVAEKLTELGLHPWVPKMLCRRYVKERKETVWFDRAYVPKLLFCVIPAIYWTDVNDIKHINGKPVELSELDLRGTPAHTVKGTTRQVPARFGLSTFKEVVEQEYAAMKALRDSQEWVCAYKPGQSLEILRGAFAGLPAAFKDVVSHAHDEHPMLLVELEVFGAKREVEVQPLAVSG